MHNDKRARVTLRAGLVALCVAHLAFAGACAKTQAKANADGPPLSIPAPPPRVLAPLDEPLAANPPTTEPNATPPRTAARPAPAAPRRPATTTTTEPEPKPEPATTQPLAPVVEPPAPAPRPAPTAADAAADRRVKDVLTKAAGDLNRIDYRKLSTDGRAQYEQSKRFTDQAEQALKDRNYAFAATLADKAAALAAELLGR